eukprot:gb/GEZN01024670.1/.p2 GENE.gb/GEZN01024670.1/~~gb/GEZN01024670.1/.p2  ORF type:complete len:110 (-),score=10.24 gb/GEZN01024670.1/:65-394(-)
MTRRSFENKINFIRGVGFVSIRCAVWMRNEPTARAGGKGKVVKHLKETHGYKTLIMVGDGATDMEARPPADAFIGFGGIAVREAVKKGADWFVTDMQDLCRPLQQATKS